MANVKRITKFILYVGAAEMEKPDSLCDATIAHLIKKDFPIDRRKKFLALYMKAVGKKAQMAVIDGWIQVRDIATFPYRKQAGKVAETVDKAFDAAGINAEIHDEETNEDTETEGGVPLDDGADGEQKSGDASE